METKVAIIAWAAAVAVFLSARPAEKPVKPVEVSTDTSLAVASEIVSTRICNGNNGFFCRGNFIFATAAAYRDLPESLKVEFDGYRGGYVALYDSVKIAIWREL